MLSQPLSKIKSRACSRSSKLWSVKNSSVWLTQRTNGSLSQEHSLEAAASRFTLISKKWCIVSALVDSTSGSCKSTSNDLWSSLERSSTSDNGSWLPVSTHWPYGCGRRPMCASHRKTIILTMLVISSSTWQTLAYRVQTPPAIMSADVASTPSSTTCGKLIKCRHI